MPKFVTDNEFQLIFAHQLNQRGVQFHNKRAAGRGAEIGAGIYLGRVGDVELHIRFEAQGILGRIKSIIKAGHHFPFDLYACNLHACTHHRVVFLPHGTRDGNDG